MLKKRDEIQEKYKWNLDSLYISDEAWEDDYKASKVVFKSLADMEGSILKNITTFTKTIELYLEGARKVSSIVTYAKMKQDENTKLSNYQSLNGRAESLGVEFREASSYITPELMSGDENIINEYLKDDKVSVYKQFIENILRARVHTLSSEGETILAQAGELFNAPSSAFEMLNGADLKFLNVNGESLTHGSFIPFMMNKDRNIM
ncbi:hypothetical protein QUF55_10040 [Clostridiaceae bacterium HSG29]|nr:hypothetical protein [Clostridiaceae bacterium HSG29]